MPPSHAHAIYLLAPLVFLMHALWHNSKMRGLRHVEGVMRLPSGRCGRLSRRSIEETTSFMQPMRRSFSAVC